MKSRLEIYTPLGTDGYELCQPIYQDDFERINSEINGVSRRSNWKPIPVRIIHEDEGKRLLMSDSPWLGAHALIFRSSAIDALGPMLREYGELLPLACSEEEMWIYNPTHVIDALNETSSSVLRFSNGKVMMIQRHVFRPDVVDEIDIFKLPNLRVSPTYLSQRFVERWKASGLKGLEFKQVWALPTLTGE